MEELEELACSIDKIIDTMTGAFPSEEMIISLFVGSVVGFEALEKQAKQLADENQISAEDINKLIKEQKEAYIKSMSGSGKQFIKSKRDELKGMVAQMKSEAQEIPKSIIKAVADSIMPTMISTGVPNPASSALRLYISLVAIKSLVLSVLLLTSKILNLILELGLGSTPFAGLIAAITKPIMEIKKKLDVELRKADDAECEKAKPEDYKVKDPDGNDIDGLKIQAVALTKDNLNITQWPLSKSKKRAVKRYIKNAADDSDDSIWGDIFMGFNDFYIKAID